MSILIFFVIVQLAIVVAQLHICTNRTVEKLEELKQEVNYFREDIR